MKNNRIRITKFLQWNDRNGCYTDENCDIEGVERMNYEDALKYFFGVMNEDFYYNITDNIFELHMMIQLNMQKKITCIMKQ